MKPRHDQETIQTYVTKGTNTMRLVLNNVRLAFPVLFEAKTVNGEGAPAFSAAFILTPNHPQLKELEAGFKTVAEAKWGAKAAAVLAAMKAQDKLCLHNGDLKPDYDGFPGNLYISARNKTRPTVVDAGRRALSQEDGKPYAGCYVNASIELWAQDNNYGKRINASLRGVQFYKDGDAFAGGGAASEDEFTNYESGADAEALA